VIEKCRIEIYEHRKSLVLDFSTWFHFKTFEGFFLFIFNCSKSKGESEYMSDFVFIFRFENKSRTKLELTIQFTDWNSVFFECVDVAGNDGFGLYSSTGFTGNGILIVEEWERSIRNAPK
jgi:hypothetical protein